MEMGDEGYAEWEELVAAALLGTDRRRGGGPAGSPEALLDAAAVHAVRRRAGLRPAAAGPRPEPAPRDPRPAPPRAAGRRRAPRRAGRRGAVYGGGGGGAAPPTPAPPPPPPGPPPPGTSPY
ncbi:hypothetical protein ACFV0A_26625, partial [Streptomyces sp. NPDC059552]